LKRFVGPRRPQVCSLAVREGEVAGLSVESAAMILRALFLLVVSCAGGPLLAQTVPPAVAPLPDTSGVPKASGNLRLPGPDPRQCGSSKYDAICAEGRWAQFSNLKLNVTAPRFEADYTIEQAANNDIHVTYREEIGERRRGGEIVVFSVSTFAYRSREEFPEPGSIIDYMMSSPIMLGSLAAVLLDHGVLGAPASVTKPRSITASSRTQFIRTAAPRTAILYAPPWSMTGTVRPAAAAGELAFTLTFRYRPVDRQGRALEGKTDTITLKGDVSYAPMRPALPESFDVTGWKIQRDDAPLAGVATLGEARKAAE